MTSAGAEHHLPPGEAAFSDPDSGEFGVVSEQPGCSSLQELPDRGEGLPLLQLETVFTAALDILAHLHASGLVHGGIHPRTIFRTPDGRVWLSQPNLPQHHVVSPADDLQDLGRSMIALARGVDVDELAPEPHRDGESPLWEVWRRLMQPDSRGRLDSVDAVRCALAGLPHVGGCAPAVRQGPRPWQSLLRVLLWSIAELTQASLLVGEKLGLPLLSRLGRSVMRSSSDRELLEQALERLLLAARSGRRSMQELSRRCFPRSESAPAS